MIKFFLYRLSFTPRILIQFFYKYYNRLLFYLSGVSYGRCFNVYTSLSLKKYKGAQIYIGDNFTFTSGNTINPISRNIRGSIFVNYNAYLQIGNNVGISSACLWVNEKIEIGNNVKIGADCIILDNNCHSLNYFDRRNHIDDVMNIKSSPIIIGDDVMIGARCIILKGVHIGERSIIGAGSVVNKDIPEDCIAIGNPCQVVKRIKL